MTLSIRVTGSGIRRFGEAIVILGSEARAGRAYSRAINHTGRIAGNEAGRALSAQTGLPKSTGKRALSRKVERASPGHLAYTITASGGNISLRYFKPRETRKGVTAAPWNSRRLYPGTFMKAGWWPKRVDKANWNRQVFERVGSGHKYNAAKSNAQVLSGAMKRERSGANFRKVKSGLFIPIEAVQGASAAAFLASGPRLQKRVEHEIKAMTKGVVS